jgi:Putative MetA-pathway of phenol degradation
MAMFVLALGGGNAFAQSIEPRAYTNTPIGMNFLIAGYAYTEGGLSVDPSVPLTNANLQTHNTVLAYARSIEVGGQSGKLDVIVPYAWLSGDAEYAGQPVERETSGFGAPLLRLSMNFIGAPALSVKEFADYQQELIVGGSLQVGLPTGQYDADKLVNIGSNRWFVKPELGVSKAWGPLALELATAATIFGGNEDFFGGQLLEQDPIYSFQGHLVYTFHSGIWAALTGTYFTGGRTTVDGVTENDLQKTTRAGVTLALPVNRHHSIKFYASTGLSIRTGTDYDAIGAAWQYRWGEEF